MTNTKMFALALLMVSSLVKADDIYLGTPGYGGTGCPRGSATAILSPDAKQLSILFDAYTVEAKGSKTVDRKSCNIAVPVHVPQGLSVSILQVDYRGYNSLPRGASSELGVEYFFADAKGPSMTKTFYGATDDNYYVSNKLLASALVWSKCGADVNLRINSNMRVKTNGAGQQAIASVDSVDMSAGLVYLLQWRTCR